MDKLATKHSIEDLLHAVNNTLNSVSMQSEVAQLYIAQGDLENSLEAMKVIQDECKKLSTLTHNFHL